MRTTLWQIIYPFVRIFLPEQLWFKPQLFFTSLIPSSLCAILTLRTNCTTKSNNMAANKLLFIVLIPFVFETKAQTAQFDMKKLDYNYAVLSDTVFKSIKNFTKQGNEAVQLTFYPDTIISSSSLVTKTDHVYASSFNGRTLYDSVVVSNPWIQEFPVTEYRLLSIQNTSNTFQKVFFYGNGYVPPGNCRPFFVNKVLVFMQVMDESGNWKDVNTVDNLKNKTKSSNGGLNSYEQINLIVKKPDGDFETDIRFKLLINAPPDFPMEKYVYSNVFKGKVNKSLLEKK